MNRIEERKRAIELKAVDVRELIKTSLPSVLPQLTPAHIDQLQRILDVAVINADIEGKGDVLDRQSIRGQIVHSNQYLRNPAIVVQRNNVLAQKIVIKPGENAIPLDHRKLLTLDALKPTSDNPDEAAYLLVVADAYEHHGVWLVLDSSAAFMYQQMKPNDPKKWRVRLMLGYKHGDLVQEITTANGSLNRHALLSVHRLGIGYNEWVHRGPTLTALESSLAGISKKLTDGWNEHTWWGAHRAEFNLVSKVSDTFGGADWPNESIWDQPHKIYVQARHLINEGKLVEAGKFALLAAYQAQSCASAVHEYVKDTTKGASRVVTILEIAVVCGEIAGWVLSVMAVGQGVIRLLSRKGGRAALQGGAQRQLTGGRPQLPAGGQTTPVTVPRAPAPAAPKPGTKTMTIHSEAGSVGSQQGAVVKEMNVSMNEVRRQLGMPAVTQPGRLALSQEVQFKRHLDEYMNYFTSELKALKARNPKWTGNDVNAIVDRADAKFGGWLPGD